MIPHDERDERIDAYVQATMPLSERESFERELQADAELREEVRGAQLVAWALLQAVPQVTPSPSLRERVVATDGRGRADRVGARTVPFDPPQAGRAVLRPQPVGPAPFAWPGWVAAAASIAVALGLGSYTVRLRQDITSLQSRLEAATSRLADAESSVARMERAVSEAQSQTAVLAAPDLAQVSLAGQAPAPDARARAFWSRSRGLVFTASQLPPLPSGRSYQLWVVTANERISAGVLPQADAGRVLHIVSTPADMPTPVAMAVTLEPEGGVPQPTGSFYLLGTTGL